MISNPPLWMRPKQNTNTSLRTAMSVVMNRKNQELDYSDLVNALPPPPPPTPPYSEAADIDIDETCMHRIPPLGHGFLLVGLQPALLACVCGDMHELLHRGVK
jgi:hypothetical protein